MDAEVSGWGVQLWRKLGYIESELGIGHYVQITGDIDFPDQVKDGKGGRDDCPSEPELTEWILLANKLTPNRKPMLYLTLDPIHAAREIEDNVKNFCLIGAHGMQHVKMNLLPHDELIYALNLCRKFSPFFRSPFLSIDMPMLTEVSKIFSTDSSFTSVMMQPFYPIKGNRGFMEYPITKPTDSSFRKKFSGRDVSAEEAADVYWNIIAARKAANKPCTFLWHPNAFTIAIMKILIDRGI